MRIEKWYLDCVTADGAGMIGYGARIAWGALASECTETLCWKSRRLPAVGRTIVGGRLPTARPAQIDWESRATRVRGQWQARMAAIGPLILHGVPAGDIEWTCYCPSAQVEVEVDGWRIEGQGYVERLVLTLPPQRLPLRELRWGRFISPTHSFVWIRWHGPNPRCWCFHNSQQVEAAMPLERELAWSGHRLHLEEGQTLRAGRIIDTVFQDRALLRRLVPASVGDVEETKWCCHAVLTDPQGRRHDGWAIHEVAIFP